MNHLTTHFFSFTIPSSMNTGLPSPWRFAASFLAVFFVSAVLLYAIDFVPEKPGSVAGTATTTPEVPMTPEVPIAIKIASIGVDTVIANPATTSVAVMEAELLKGAVRYPASALLGETGTVYLFGHQSYLPVVHNKAYKAFNDLQKLKAGDIITVSSATATYTYAVRTVTLTTAKDGVVPLESTGRTLILSTCNSYSADHEERYVVTADFISKQPII